MGVICIKLAEGSLKRITNIRRDVMKANDVMLRIKVGKGR